MDETKADQQRPLRDPNAYPGFHAVQPCGDYVERKSYTQNLLEYFQPDLEDDESRRYLLWGTGGVGKTQIAAHFIEKHAREMAKHILWVRADTYQNFICDFRRIPRILTGKPRSDVAPNDLQGTLGQIRDTLEQTPEDWFLVLDDCTLLQRITPNSENIRLSDFLPDCGRILITSSFTMVETSETGTALLPSLQLDIANARVQEIGTDEALILARNSRCGTFEANFETDHSHLLADGLAQPDLRPLFITLMCAAMRTLRIGYDTYMCLLTAKKRQFRDAVAREAQLLDLPLSLSIALDISLDCARDLNANSVDILQCMTFLHWRDINLRYLWQLPRFSSLKSDEFLSAVDTLIDLCIIQKLERPKPIGTTVRMHSVVHQWMSAEMEPFERDDYLCDAIEAFGQRLQADREGWLFPHLLPHVWELVRHATRSRTQSRSFLRLLMVVARSLHGEGMSVVATALISQAVNMITARWPVLALPHRTPTSIVLQHINIKHLQSKIAYRSRKFRLAERVLRSALCLVNGPVLDVSATSRSSLRTLLWEDLADPLHAQEKFDEELELREGLLVLETNHSSIRYMRKLENLAACLFRKGDLEKALEASSEVMKWIDQDERGRDPFFQPWIALHAQVLLQSGQPRSALETCIRPSLDDYVTSLDANGLPFWELGYTVACALYELDEYDEHERVSLAILQRPSPGIQPDVFPLYVRLVCLLTETYQRKGRLVEASILLDYIHLRVQNEATDQDDLLPLCRYNVVRCLYRLRRDDDANDAMRRYAADIEKWTKQRNRTIDFWLKQDRDVLQAYQTGFDRLRAGSTIDEDPFFQETRPLLEVAGDRYGFLGSGDEIDPRTHVDPFGIGSAKRSEVLDFFETWSWAGKSIIKSIAKFHSQRSDMKDQRLITDYFRACRCHRHHSRRSLHRDSYRR